MADVNFTSQSAGRANVVTGAFTGDASVTKVTLGFTPRYVKLVNITDALQIEKIEGMAATQALQTVTAGTQTVTTSSQITIDEDGFTVPAAVAADAKDIVFVAMA